MSLKKILSFIVSDKQNDILLKLVFALGLLALIVLRRTNLSSAPREGFDQSEKYVLKRGTDAYDEFYAPAYEYLYSSVKRAAYETQQIIRATEPDPNNSRILDIGSGTGTLVEAMTSAGFSTFGIDKSEAMVEYSSKVRPDTQIKCGDATNAMEFEPATFTHVLCMDFAVYSFENKAAFFRNCHKWLSPHGYLVLHLVSPAKFNTIVPAGKPALVDDPQKHSNVRITDTAIDFSDFKYKSSYDFGRLPSVILTETFTDNLTHHVRQNEHTLFMDDEDRILDLAERCRFALKGKFSAEHDKHQHVYILEKIGV